MLKKSKHNQLIITKIYTHINYITTTTNTFIHNIKPFIITNTLTNFNHNKHLISLKYITKHSNQIIITKKLLPTPIPTNKTTLHKVILPLLNKSNKPFNNNNLINYNLNSIHIITLTTH